MSKKKKSKNDSLEQILFRNCLQACLQRDEQETCTENPLQLAKAEGARYEREQAAQRDSDTLNLALGLHEARKELRKGKKSMNEMTVYVRALDKRCQKMEKKLQALSDEVDTLQRSKTRQKAKLKKSLFQIRQQKKILRYMGTYMGINNPTDTLENMLKKCGKKLDSGYIKKGLPVIDAPYREVTE